VAVPKRKWVPPHPVGQDEAAVDVLVGKPLQAVRIWMSDGMNDIEVDSSGRPDLYVAGSWPLNNIQLANAATSIVDAAWHARSGPTRLPLGPGQGNQPAP
jgi:hypothetical protein